MLHSRAHTSNTPRIPITFALVSVLSADHSKCYWDPGGFLCGVAYCRFPSDTLVREFVKSFDGGSMGNIGYLGALSESVSALRRATGLTLSASQLRWSRVSARVNKLEKGNADTQVSTL